MAGYWAIGIQLSTGEVENHKVQANARANAIAKLRQRITDDFRVINAVYSTGNKVAGYRSPFTLGN